MTEFLSIYNGLGNQRMEDVGIWAFFFIILYSLLASFLFSSLYVHFFEKRSTGSQINRAFPLLSISITVIFITVQFSLPLSLGLLGALSFVRFRTPIKEPEEIGFIMMVVASSLSCAPFHLLFPLILVVVAYAALYVIDKFSLLGSKKVHGGMLIITGPKNEDTSKKLRSIEDDLQTVLPGTTLHSIACAEGITATFVFNKVKSVNLNSTIATFLEVYPEYHFNLMTNRNTVL